MISQREANGAAMVAESDRRVDAMLSLVLHLKQTADYRLAQYDNCLKFDDPYASASRIAVMEGHGDIADRLSSYKP